MEALSNKSDDVGARFVIAVEDISGAWNRVEEAVKARSVLQNVVLKNKFGNSVVVDELAVEFWRSNTPRIQRLKSYAFSPVTWFRNPFAILITVCCEDGDDYKHNVRMQIKSILDEASKYPGSYTDYVILYVVPNSSDANAKGPKKVFEMLRHDFSSKRREHCCRLDVAGRKLLGSSSGSGIHTGMEDLDRHLRDAVRITFEARETSYDEELRKLMAVRFEPGWSFSTLFLVKDSLAVMLESAGLIEDALREYYELEATYLEGMTQANLQGYEQFGDMFGSDSAGLLSSTWRDMRRSVLQTGGVNEFFFRQYLFARQANLLFKLDKTTEVAQRGLQFVRTFSALLDYKATEGVLPPGFAHVWSATACISLAAATNKRWEENWKDEVFGESLKMSNHGPAAGSPIRAAERSALTRTHSADEVHSPTTRERTQHARMPSEFSKPATALQRSEDDNTLALGKSTSEQLAKVNYRRSQTPPAVGAPLDDQQEPALEAAQELPPAIPTVASSGVSPTANVCLPSPAKDWQLGITNNSTVGEEFIHSAFSSSTAVNGAPLSPKSRMKVDSRRMLYCLLAALYATARTELIRAAHALAMVEELGEPHGRINLLSCVLPSRDLQRFDSGKTAVTASGSSGAPSPHHHSRSSSADIRFSNEALNPFTRDSAASMMPEKDKPGDIVNLRPPTNLKPPPTAPPPPPPSPPPARKRASTPNATRFSPLGGDSAHITAAASTMSRNSSASSLQTELSTSLIPKIPGLKSRLKSEAPSSAGENEVPAERPMSSFSAMMNSLTNYNMRSTMPVNNSHGNSSVDLREVELAIESDAEDSPHSNDDASLHSDTTPNHLVIEHPPVETEVEKHEDAGHLPPWLSDWRFKLALSSKEVFEELYIQLSLAAAQCYGRARRNRLSAMLRADVADVLMRQGRHVPAALMYKHAADLTLRDGWLQLAGEMMQHLAQCQQALQQPALLNTSLQLLSLSPFVSKLDQAAALTSLNALAHQSIPPEVKQPVDALDIFAIHPVKGHYSRFFGRTDRTGTPKVVPTRSINDSGVPTHSADVPGRDGSVCVGDVATLIVKVVNNLSQAVQLENVVLTLSLLQDVEVAMSPRLVETLAVHKGWEMRQEERLGRDIPWNKSTTPRLARKKSTMSSTGIFGWQWEETEELICQLLPPSKELSDVHEQKLKNDVTLQPGPNYLLFVARPLKRGVYTLKFLTAHLGKLELRIPMRLRKEDASSQLTVMQRRQLSGGVEESRNHLGMVDDNGRIHEDAVVLNVQACQPRMEVGAVVMKGSLVAGQDQWLGLLVRPIHDKLHKAHLRFSAGTTSERMRSVLMQPLELQEPSVQPLVGRDSLGASYPAISSKLPFINDACLTCVEDPVLEQKKEQQDGEGEMQDGDAVQERISSSLGTSSSGSQSECPTDLQWIKLHGTGVELPSWASNHTSITWLWMRAGPLPLQHEVVRVNIGLPQRQLGLNREVSRQQSRQASMATLGAMEVEVNLEYSAGCLRSHASLIALQVTHPFRVYTTAREIGDEKVMVQVSLQSQMVHPAIVNRAQLIPQKGFTLAMNMLDVSGLLPITVQPAAVLHMSVIVQQDPQPEESNENEIMGRKDVNLLEVDYEVVHLQAVSEKPVAVPALGENSDVQRRINIPTPPLPKQEWFLGTADSASSPTKENGKLQQADSLAGNKMYRFRHLISLEMYPGEASPYKLVYVRLLGPFTAEVGVPLTLTWRLERAAEYEGGSGTEVVLYEVTAEGDGWRPAGKRSGSVGLAASPGATATVEASWMPIKEGTLQVPELRLRNFPHQEVFDVGSATDTIHVLPQLQDEAFHEIELP